MYVIAIFVIAIEVLLICNLKTGLAGLSGKLMHDFNFV